MKQITLKKMLLIFIVLFVQFSFTKRMNLKPDNVGQEVVKFMTKFNEMEKSFDSIKGISTEDFSTLETKVQKLDTLVSADNGFEDKLKELQETLEKIKPQHSFIYWGNQDCPNDRSEVVFGGRAGGGFYSSGGTSKLLCVGYENINTGNKVELSGGSFSRVTEANFQVEGIIKDNNSPFKNYHNAQLLCSRCLTNGKETKTFIRRQTCPEKYILQYKGYMFGSHHQHRRTESICVSEKAVQHHDENSGFESVELLYPVGLVNDNRDLYSDYPNESQIHWPCVVCTLN